ncbi:MAG: hypothetical protein EZS28_021050 [Streblomastix strix]|uniref:Uncharacterized protein n=1 Tax=Streblomastix strix TaxID=222440 RepID=A0A5J4VMC5_9EUKA|nr:MAG: hypothetical protein EZS28_021050 [Streblomastix strix]
MTQPSFSSLQTLNIKYSFSLTLLAAQPPTMSRMLSRQMLSSKSLSSRILATTAIKNITIPDELEGLIPIVSEWLKQERDEKLRSEVIDKGKMGIIKLPPSSAPSHLHLSFASIQQLSSRIAQISKRSWSFTDRMLLIRLIRLLALFDSSDKVETNLIRVSSFFFAYLPSLNDLLGISQPAPISSYHFRTILPSLPVCKSLSKRIYIGSRALRRELIMRNFSEIPIISLSTQPHQQLAYQISDNGDQQIHSADNDTTGLFQDNVIKSIKSKIIRTRKQKDKGEADSNEDNEEEEEEDEDDQIEGLDHPNETRSLFSMGFAIQTCLSGLFATVITGRAPSQNYARINQSSIQALPFWIARIHCAAHGIQAMEEGLTLLEHSLESMQSQPGNILVNVLYNSI